MRKYRVVGAIVVVAAVVVVAWLIAAGGGNTGVAEQPTERPVIYVTMTGEAPTDEPLAGRPKPDPADTAERPTPYVEDPSEMPVSTPTP